MATFLGFKWLSNYSGIVPAQPFRVVSKAGTVRKSVQVNGFSEEYYPAQSVPAETIPAHLVFALKNEVLHLEFLARFFATVDPKIIEDWICNEPTGSFARRAGFLYEWLTGNHLDVADIGGNYVDALPEDRYFTSTRPVNSQRWRVRDNLPGTPAFCPMILRTRDVATAEQYDCAAALGKLEIEFGADLLIRSAVWLTIKESRASFLIEHEEKKEDRIKRFASVMEERCGKGSDPLDEDEITMLQTAILGVAIRYGFRKSPVFVGHTAGYSEVVDYVAPRWDKTGQMLDGLRATMKKTAGRASIIRATIASFGFVYIHPMADGNGRISRFLVNDVLRRDGAVPTPFILPISATITDSVKARVGYDHALETLSKPLMGAYKDQYRFGTEVTYEDGVVSNFHFDAYDDASPAWQYPDLTEHAAYMGEVIIATIEQEMIKEATYLRNQWAAREAVKNVMEGPNTDIDRIIRSVMQGGAWRVSGKLAKEFPLLADPDRASRVVQAIHEVFEGPVGENSNQDDDLGLQQSGDGMGGL